MSKIRRASRKKVKIKAAIQGPSGSGKTMSSLLLAKGLVGGDMRKVCVIDTENGSSGLYSHLGDSGFIPIAHFSPKSYATAIDDVIADGSFECIVIDSISHCWKYLLEKKDQMTGNSFTNWAKISPMHDRFVKKILDAPIHIICTMRSKETYAMNDAGGGKLKIEKMGLSAIQRDGIGYEFTLVLEVNAKHNAIASKDRTNLFPEEEGEFRITEQTGQEILNWCNVGATQAPKALSPVVINKVSPVVPVNETVEYNIDQVLAMINKATTGDRLKKIWGKFGGEFPDIKGDIKTRMKELKAALEAAKLIK